MTKIAYKVNTTNPNLPQGFIVDHFETEQDMVEGYIIVDQPTFQKLIHNNVALMRQHEVSLGIQGAPQGIPIHPRRDASEAQPVDHAMMEERKKVAEQHAADARLFQEFMAWRKSQSQGS